MCMARHGMLSGGWVPCTPVSITCVQVLSRMLVYVLCLCISVKKDLCKVTGEKTDARESQGWRHRHRSASMKRFADLSLSFQLAVRCAGVLAFRFPIVGVLGIIAITTVHHHARTQALAWHGIIWHASVGTCNLSVLRK